MIRGMFTTPRKFYGNGGNYEVRSPNYEVRIRKPLQEFLMFVRWPLLIVDWRLVARLQKQSLDD